MRNILIIVGILILCGVVVFFSFQGSSTTLPFSSNSGINWAFDGQKWQASSPPLCPDPLVIDSPVDLSLVSGILYPGQIRGDFKAHGGFRFDNRDANDIEVRAIMDGYVLKASRYEDGGEIQNFMFYVNDCGIMIMHDHLFTLTPKLQAVFDKLPVGRDGDSRTTNIEPKVFIKNGELLATEVGYKNFEGRKNIFIDFGLYDLRKPNGIKSDGEYAPYGICWFDYLGSEDGKKVRSLPAGGNEGKVSDYCQ